MTITLSIALSRIVLAWIRGERFDSVEASVQYAEELRLLERFAKLGNSNERT